MRLPFRPKARLPEYGARGRKLYRCSVTCDGRPGFGAPRRLRRRPAARVGAPPDPVSDLREARSRLPVFRFFASRAASELERSRLESTLRAQEHHLTDLFEEAPIAYVHEGKDTRFIRANRVARELLGITAEEVPNITGASLVPDNPDAQRRLKEALRLLSAGSDGQGVVIELRRKDNGRPVWVQWWSRPAREGDYTRSMFVDITERVLLEREQARLTAQNSYLREG